MRSIVVARRGWRAKHGALRFPEIRRVRCRDGFVLLAVLWVMVGVSTLGLAVALTARRAVRTARNRRDATIATWQAEACAARAQVVIADALMDGRPSFGSTTGITPWRDLDQIVTTTPLLAAPACEVTLRPTGRALNANTADAEQLTRFFAALQGSPATADSLADALLDWRDVDDLPRPRGAERTWYEERGRAPPRNGPFVDVRELPRVRGIAVLWTHGLDSLVDVELGRIDWNHAALPVLASLPGITDEVLGRVRAMRQRRVAITDLLGLSATLSPPARSAFVARYADLTRLTTTEPDAWLLTSRARVGHPRLTAVLELRLVRAGPRAAIVRRRMWLE